MSILKSLRTIAILILPLAAGACAGSDPVELIPVGLRTSIAAEDRGQKKGSEAAVSVNDMLARARGGQVDAAKAAPAAQTSAAADVVAAEPTNAQQPIAAVSTEPLPQLLPPITMAARQGGAAPDAGAVHPLWAKMSLQRSGGTATSAPADVVVPAAAPAVQRPALAPIARPSAGPGVVIKFPGSDTEIPDGEKARLEAAVTLHKATVSSVRVMAGPASEGAVFQRLLIAERRSQAVDKALPPDLERSRVFSPEVDPDTVRVEFQRTRR
jgi:hypothetical protein